MSLSFVPVVFLAGGAVLIAWGLHRRTALKLLPQDWLPVTGTVVEVGGSRRVTYQGADGRRLRIDTPGTKLRLDSEVAVLVDPRDSSRARLAEVDRVAAQLVTTLLGLGVLSLLIGAGAVVAFA